jgi:hypothetical protein
MRRHTKVLTALWLAILVVVGISWRVVPDWRQIPGGILTLVAGAIISVVTVVSGVLDILVKVQELGEGETARKPDQGLLGKVGSTIRPVCRRITRWLGDYWKLVIASLLLVGVAIGAFLLARPYGPLLLVILALALADALFSS